MAWCALAATAAVPGSGKAPGAGAKGGVPKAATTPVAAPGAAGEPSPSPEALEFFEKEVRPVLAENCYLCHGATLQQGGLRLDSRAELLKKLKSGAPAVVAGRPEESSLIRAIRHDGKIKMPPQGKLPERAVAALTRWVRMGAPWPEVRGRAGYPRAGGGGGGRGELSIDNSQLTIVNSGRNGHWAFRPVRTPAVPAVKNREWVKTPVDAFVLAKLEAQGMAPNPPADRRTLIRRAYLDLTGLPPTAAEVEAFVADRSPNAWEKVVDRLLTSPHYGERWGRHWLDVARFGETKGFLAGGQERRFPYAYTYRDYVVRAFNEDKPYDRFLLEQIAADQLDLGEDRGALAALGFLTVGKRFQGRMDDIIDDRIDVVTRGTQALTVTCARCHDHKYDPIPTADYYSLYGVFASSVEPKELPVIAPPERGATYLAFEKQYRALQKDVDDFLAAKHAEYMGKIRESMPAYFLAAHTAVAKGTALPALARQRDLSVPVLTRWRGHLLETRRSFDAVMAPWHAFAALPDAEFARKAPELAARFAANADPARRINPLVAAAFAGAPPASLQELADRYGRVLKTIDARWKALQAQSKSGDAPQELPEPEAEQLRQLLYSEESPLHIPLAAFERMLERDDRNRLRALRNKVERFAINSPDAPPRAMVLEDAPEPVTPRIFVRGNPASRGEEVPRQYLALLCGADRQPFRKGSGRLELAQAIASPENPLTARVMVNRVWGWHFGQALVRTPSDFGLRSAPPSHPELLDYLASVFSGTGTVTGTQGSKGAGSKGEGALVDQNEYGLAERRGARVKGAGALQTSRTVATSGSRGSSYAIRNTQYASAPSPQPPAPGPAEGLGWSIKRLHKLLMLSSTYQMSSAENPKQSAVDPENVLLWRMNRRRLDFEAMRDSLLAVSGKLDRTLGGTSVDLEKSSASTRRTLYSFIDRDNLPNLFRTFDFSNPDLHSPQRHTTTVPQQALFLMNSPFVLEQASHLARRPEVAGAKSPEERVRQLHRLVYGREASAEEVALGVQFTAEEPKPAAAAEAPTLWRYGYGEVDESAGRTRTFTPLAHWSGEQWQAGPEFPDPKLGFIRVTSVGVAPGRDAAHATIRRWTAPVDGTVSITGTLFHRSPKGDGVRARIVSSRAGVLGTWIVHNGREDVSVRSVAVRKGDTLDFVVDCRANGNSDFANWTPEIRLAGGTGPAREWSSAAGFRSPAGGTTAIAADAWTAYAQVLLLSNEFNFVD